MIIRVLGEPKAQPRAKAFNRGKHAGVYDPGTANGWKALVAKAAMDHPDFPKVPLTGPICVDIAWFLPRPKRLCRKCDPSGPVCCTSKPDRDNLDKAILDVLTQIRLWEDDAQVCQGTLTKWYHAKGGRTGATITVSGAVLPTDVAFEMSGLAPVSADSEEENNDKHSMAGSVC